MNPSSPQEEEERYLTSVIAAIDGEIVNHGVSASDLQEKVRTLEATDFNERNAAASMYDSGARKVIRLAEQRQNPYFGRVDFDDLNDSKSERIYLGSAHIRYKGVDYVHDWRAPVGELFYQTYGGRTTYRAPEGIIKVDIKLKRRLTVKEGHLQSIVDTFDGSDPDPMVADNLLADMLRRNAGTSMGQIVRSIQAEQDAVIRTGGDIVVVQGPAGSGKTVVALHRAAYLLYQMRQSPDPKLYAVATASGMRVFSPNRIFSEYISHVLPDLHEDAIEQDVFEQFLIDQLLTQLRADGVSRKFKVQRKEDHFDRMLGADVDEYERLAEACRAKTAPSIARELQAFLVTEERSIRSRIGTAVMDAAGDEKPILHAVDVIRRFDAGAEEGLSLLGRVKQAMFFVEDELAERQRQLRDGKRAATSRDGRFGAGLTYRQQQALAAEIEQLKLLTRNLKNIAGSVDKKPLVELYGDFWRSRLAGNESAVSSTQASGPLRPQSWGNQTGVVHSDTVAGLAANTIAALEAGSIRYEDVPAMVCLNGFYRGFPELKGTIHAIVDECQDYTPLHYEFLKRSLPAGCTMTVVGDLNQTVDETVSLGNYEALAEIFPGRTKKLELTRSYRSSMEITRFASQILGEGFVIDNVRRSGREPALRRLDDANDLAPSIAETAKEMLARADVDDTGGSAYRQVAVICRSTVDARKLHSEMSKVVSATLLTPDAAHLSEGILVVPIAQAKGLEFDAVIVHDAGAHLYHRPADRRLLYTACTRALHELVLFYTGEVSGLITA